MKDIVIGAVENFIKNDSDLLDLTAHEQAISHRIGVYLENLFETDDDSLRVDCEYNKHLEGEKVIILKGFDLDRCNVCRCRSCLAVIAGGLDILPEKLFRPDILIHSRGNDDKNLAAIEIKKAKECEFDQVKLKALTGSRDKGGLYGYKLGVFIWFVDKVPQYKWFVGGVEV